MTDRKSTSRRGPRTTRRAIALPAVVMAVVCGAAVAPATAGVVAEGLGTVISRATPTDTTSSESSTGFTRLTTGQRGNLARGICE